mmetsp:Transcript_15717/g.50379  ORF Transcript_15717/g.50379 Transcript_15717/m.50379 type:complete len:208 (-) Transcript_15717:359-982(-)
MRRSLRRHAHAPLRARPLAPPARPLPVELLPGGEVQLKGVAPPDVARLGEWWAEPAHGGGGGAEEGAARRADRLHAQVLHEGHLVLVVVDQLLDRDCLAPRDGGHQRLDLDGVGARPLDAAQRISRELDRGEAAQREPGGRGPEHRIRCVPLRDHSHLAARSRRRVVREHLGLQAQARRRDGLSPARPPPVCALAERRHVPALDSEE